MMNDKKIYDLDSTLSFGKYQTMPLRFVLASDPEYIMWCLDNLPWFRLSDIAMDYFCHFHRTTALLASRRADILSKMASQQQVAETSTLEED